MSKIFRGSKRFISTLLLVAFSASFLSACSPNKTQVAGWWYDQQWQSASVGSEADQ